MEKCFNHISQNSIKKDRNSTQRELAHVTVKSRNRTGRTGFKGLNNFTPTWCLLASPLIPHPPFLSPAFLCQIHFQRDPLLALAAVATSQSKLLCSLPSRRRQRVPPGSMSSGPWTESHWPGGSTSRAYLWISCVSGDKMLWVVRPKVGSRLRFI